MKYLLSVITIFACTLTGCGEISSSGDRVNISISALPSTAGNVLSSGGDEVGNTADFLALPNDGWQFVKWSGDVESDENPLEIVLEDDLNLVANFEVMNNNYQIDMEMSDGETVVELVFGQVSGATDVYDSGIDLEAPPSAPPNSLFSWFDNDDRKLFKDFRSSVSTKVQWKLMIEPGSNSKISLQWLFEENYFEGNIILTDEEESFYVDMIDESSTTLNVNTPSEFFIYYYK